MAIDKIKLNSLGTTGTASSSNFLRGDMAWTAIAGDIESVVAGTGLNGGGTSGDVTLNIDAAQSTITSLANSVVISTSGAITTTGAFTSIGIDDNADALAMTIGSNERIGIGTANEPAVNNTVTPKVNIAGSGVEGSAQLTRHTSVGAGGAMLQLGATRGTDVNSYTILQDNDGIGTLAWFGADGTDFAQAAQISVTVDGTPGANDMPAQMSFDTTADGAASPTQRMTLGPTGILNLLDNVLARPELKDYSETKIGVAAAATVDLDMTSGNVFTVTADQNTTFTFSNPSPTGKSCAFTLIWTQDSSDRTITWPGTVDWPGGAAPDVTSGSGKIDVYTFFTLDAGTIWYGFQAGADLG